MDSAFVIKLGDGVASKRGVGSKGKLLDVAMRAGLPVPAGFIILDTAADLAVLHGAIETVGRSVRLTDAEKLATLLQLPALTRPAAVRSAFGAEDGEKSALAGYFRTVLGVDTGNPQALGRALETVWSSARLPNALDTSDGEIFRRDVLVMEMVASVRSGVAFTEREFEDDLVNYTDGTSERMLAGEIAGETLVLPKLRGWEKFALPSDLPAWAARLQALLRDVRRWLGAKDWDVEWADDGKTCWLLQLRPVTRPTLRDEAFTIANHKEILPPLPSPFMTSLVESCAFDLYGYYRAFDPSLPKSRAFIEVFDGRPYINLSLMTETMRHWGLPTRLITDNIGGTETQPFGLNIRRFLSRTLDLTLIRQLMDQLMSVRNARRASEALNEKLPHIGGTLPELIETGRTFYIDLVQQMFSLLAAGGPAVSLLARAGVLNDYLSGHETISTRKFRAQEEIRAYVKQHPALRASLQLGELPDEAGFLALWQAYLETFGHRGTFESDFSRPRDSEKPAVLLRSLANPPAAPTQKAALTPLARLLKPMWFYAAQIIRAREQWRHDMMRGFAAVRSALLASAEALAADGVLPDAEHVWLLRIDEARELAGGWRPDTDFWAQRKAELAQLEAIQPPDLIWRYDDTPSATLAADGKAFHGIPLTRGEVAGQAWVLNEPAAVLPEGFCPETTILVARSIDIGWVGTFGLVAGVAVETGGHLSHGSIVLREIGLPAVTNVSRATQAIRTGDRITLNAARGELVISPVNGQESLDSPLPE